MTGVQQPASAVPPSDLEIDVTNQAMRRAQRRPRFADPFELLPRGLTKLNSIWIGLTYPFASRDAIYRFISPVRWTDKGRLESASVIQ